MPHPPFRTDADEIPGLPNIDQAVHLPPVPDPDSAVRITAIETAIPERMSPHLLVMRIHTDAGIVGCGETFMAAEAASSMIHGYMARRLIGADALAIESHWRFLYERMANVGARGTELRAISAIDLCLWDILGQVCKQPVYRLLGGPVRSRIPVYNSCGNPTYSVNPAEGKKHKGTWPGMGSIGQPHPLADSYNYFHNPVELARELIELGYTGMKIWPFDLPAIMRGPSRISSRDIDTALNPLRKIREAVGMDIDVMIDGHGHFQLPAALRIADALRDLKPLWLEDVIKMDNLDTVADFRRQSGMPISTSEMLLCAPEYAAALEKRAADFVMIDPTWVGGISETVRIGRLAQAYNLPVTMHDATGPLTLFAGLHVNAALPNACYQETVRAQIAAGYADLIDATVTIEDGFIDLPRTPGIGAKFNDDLFAEDAPGYRITRS